MKKILLLLFIMLFCFTVEVSAGSKFFTDNNKNIPPDPVYNTGISVPKGYTLTVTVQEPVSVINVSTGDNINTVLNNDFYYKGQIIAAEGSIIKGKIIKKVFDNDDKTQLIIKFTEVLAQNGRKIPISGIVKTDDKSGIIYIEDSSDYFINGDIQVIIMQPVTYFP